MKRIDWDLLEIDDNQVYYHEGKPFSGVAYETYPDRTLCGEQSFTIGVPDGPSRSWYKTGRLESEINYKLGWRNGLHREWYPDGKLKLEELIELGVPIERKQWNEVGVLTEHFRINPNSLDSQQLQRLHANEEQRVRRIHELVAGAHTKQH